MGSPVQRGYLLLADISGYTSFMAGSELEHAQGILSNILTLVIHHLTPTLTLAEVEGDAVFVFVPHTRVTRGEVLLELIESTYVAFRDRQKSMQRNATCTCRACQSIPALDLKFVVHYGEYILQSVSGRDKPVGSAVNLAHRLLKNQVREGTGWHGYALFSQEGLEKTGVWPSGMHDSAETYEHFGQVQTHSVNLDSRYSELTEGLRAFLSPENADVTVTHEFAAPPVLVWDWLNDPHKRNIWMEGSNWGMKERPSGRTGPGAQNHCSNARFTEHILDWRPFEYYTVYYMKGLIKILMTGQLKPTDRGTAVALSMRLEGKLPRWILCPLCKLIATRMMKVKTSFGLIEQLIAHALKEQKAVVA
jgi:uncharacterized protein YndB with AHSA1/START domain